MFKKFFSKVVSVFKRAEEFLDKASELIAFARNLVSAVKNAARPQAAV
jgi:hypothetical protein